MFKMLGAAVAALVLACAGTASAATVMIDYERHAHTDAVRTLSHWATTPGFRTASTSGAPVIWGVSSAHNGDHGGATFGAPRGSISISRIDNGYFDLAGFLAGDLPNGGISGSFTIHGFDDNASATPLFQQTFTLDSLIGLQAFNPTGFTGINRLMFSSNDLYNIGLQIDNVVLTNTGPVSALPEPAAWAMMIMGFGAVGALLRRRRTVFA